MDTADVKQSGSFKAWVWELPLILKTTSVFCLARTNSFAQLRVPVLSASQTEAEDAIMKLTEVTNMF